MQIKKKINKVGEIYFLISHFWHFPQILAIAIRYMNTEVFL